jgi:hypothetical protein
MLEGSMVRAYVAGGSLAATGIGLVGRSPAQILPQVSGVRFQVSGRFQVRGFRSQEVAGIRR